MDTKPSEAAIDVARYLCDLYGVGHSDPPTRNAVARYIDAFADARVRAATAELGAENAKLWQHHGGHLPECGGRDEIARCCACGYLQGEAYRELVAELAEWRSLAQGLDKLCAAYRTGRTPSEATFTKIAVARAAIRSRESTDAQA